jgi:WD40 repeat protein
VPSMRLLADGPNAGGHNGEVLTCRFTPDGMFVLSGGWDGHLRLWDAESSTQITAFRVSDKPVSACAVTPNGQQWLAGTLDGLLSFWDCVSQQQVTTFLAHTRPISALQYAPDGVTLVTAAWDRHIRLWNLSRDRASRNFTGHEDCVTGCTFTPDGDRLVSWAFDSSVRVWDVSLAKPVHVLNGHEDRVLSAAVSPDGNWAVTGGRDGILKLWDLFNGKEERSRALPAEVRACVFVGGGEWLLTVDSNGRIALHALPNLEIQTDLVTRLAVLSVDVDLTESRLALGCGDGKVRFIGLEDFANSPLRATATHTVRRGTALQRLFGKERLTEAYECTCPACFQSFDLPGVTPNQSTPCPHCRRKLRLNAAPPAEPATSSR